MKQVLDNAAVCPHCGAPARHTAPGMPPPRGTSQEAMRYDIEALAAEAVDERAFDETTKIRVTQQDIRKLLQKRMKVAK